MTWLVALATALLWKTIFFGFLHGGSRTLADETPAAALCYYPSGDIDDFGWPCTNDGTHSMCCSEGYVCMNSGVCKLKGVQYYERQSCTDKMWETPRCSGMCLLDPNGAFSANWSVVKACTNQNKKDTKYCCNEMPGLDINCCYLGQNAQFVNFGSMDVHGTALILEGGSVSSIPSTSDDNPTTRATSTSPGPKPFISEISTSVMTDDIAIKSTSTVPAPAPPRTEVSTFVMTVSPTDPTEPSIVTITIKDTIPAQSDQPVTATSPSNVNVGATSTTSYIPSNFATPTPTLVVDAGPDPGTTAKQNRPTITGVAVGVPIGLIAIVLLLYILRRYRRCRNSCIATVYFPPDPIDPFADRIIPKIELDATNAIHELDGTTAPSELGDSTTAVADPKRPSSIVSELEGSPVTPPVPYNRASMATTLNRNRGSNTSSLAPPQANRTMAARPSMAESLSIVAQQHHGSGHKLFLTPPRPHASHRLSRPTSGLLPEIGLSEDETLSTPEPSTVAENKQESNETQESSQSEQAVALQETHEVEQLPISEAAPTSGEAAQAGEIAREGESVQAGESAQAGENAHEGETLNEGKASHESDNDAQPGEVLQAGEATSEVEAARKSEDSQQSDTKSQAGGDMQAGEKTE